MALDFAYAPKFVPATTQAGGGGDGRPPIPMAPVASGGHGRPPDAPKAQATPTSALHMPAPIAKLALCARAYQRWRERRRVFAAELAAHFEALESSHARWRLC